MLKFIKKMHFFLYIGNVINDYNQVEYFDILQQTIYYENVLLMIKIYFYIKSTVLIIPLYVPFF